MKKISITIAGHRTSITLEQEFIEQLKKIAEHKKVSIAELIKQIDISKTASLTSAIRVFVLQHKI